MECIQCMHALYKLYTLHTLYTLCTLSTLSALYTLYTLSTPYALYTLSTLYTLYTLYIHWLSASKMTYLWVISVDDALLLGYQRRRCLIFGLSSSKMTYFRLYRGGWAHTLRCDSEGDRFLYSISLSNGWVGKKLSVS